MRKSCFSIKARTKEMTGKNIICQMYFFLIIISNIPVMGCSVLNCMALTGCYTLLLCNNHLFESSSSIWCIINIPADGVACHHGHNLQIFMGINLLRLESPLQY